MVNKINKSESKSSNCLNGIKSKPTVELRRSKVRQFLKKTPNSFLNDLKLKEQASNDQGQSKLVEIIKEAKSKSVDLSSINNLLNCGILDHLICGLQCPDNEWIQYNCLWILRNITAGTSEETLFVYNSGVFEYVMPLMKSGNSGICMQSLACLGNIMGESHTLCSEVLHGGIVDQMQQIIHVTNDVPVIETIAWIMVNICSYAEYLSPNHITDHIMPMMVQLQKFVSPNITIFIWNALSFISNNSQNNDLVQCLIENNVFCCPFPPLTTDSEAVIIEMISTFQGVTTGTRKQIEDVFTIDVIKQIINLMTLNKRPVEQSCLVLLTSLATTGPVIVERLYECNVIGTLCYKFDMLSFNMRNVLNSLHSIILNSSPAQISQLQNSTIGQCLRKSIKSDDSDLVKKGLELLLQIMTHNKNVRSSMSSRLNRDNKENIIEKLQLESRNEVISTLANKIYNAFLSKTEMYYDEQVETETAERFPTLYQLETTEFIL